MIQIITRKEITIRDTLGKYGNLMYFKKLLWHLHLRICSLAEKDNLKKRMLLFSLFGSWLTKKKLLQWHCNRPGLTVPFTTSPQVCYTSACLILCWIQRKKYSNHLFKRLHKSLQCQSSNDVNVRKCFACIFSILLHIF